MKKVMIALVLSVLFLCCAAAASAGVCGHFVNEEDGTYIFILKEAISNRLSGVYIGTSRYILGIERDDKADGSIRIFTSMDESGAIIDLRLQYEDDSEQAVLVTGSIHRFDSNGALIEEQCVPDMQDVRFVRHEIADVSQLKGTRWNRYTMTVSGSDRTYPFDGSVIEFFDSEENAGQIPDNAVRISPFTYDVKDDTLYLKIEAGGEITEATARIESDVMIVKIENSTLYFLPADR
jgi:hypothetical protein